MAEESQRAPDRTEGGGTLPAPPPLPARLTDIRPLLLIGTGGWLVAFVVLVVTGVNGDWRWACLAGFVLGFVGLGIVMWQRAAARRGSRGAQRL